MGWCHGFGMLTGGEEPMERYHLRRTDKELTGEGEIERVLIKARYLTLAMCHENQPYLVALNHGFDSKEHCLYFHCAGSGRKIDVLRTNPNVWGMVIEDHGYLDGDCDHAYRSVMFAGTVTFLDKDSDKRRALEVMIRQQESNPEKVMAELLVPSQVEAVTIGRIDIDELSAKESLPNP
jgi:nitroimidazol reductase NimA-like FMN-containing flavoprotein (pyridoxamine 5'-phosphate oxidase superfamily)